MFDAQYQSAQHRTWSRTQARRRAEVSRLLLRGIPRSAKRRRINTHFLEGRRLPCAHRMRILGIIAPAQEQVSPLRHSQDIRIHGCLQSEDDQPPTARVLAAVRAKHGARRDAHTDLTLLSTATWSAVTGAEQPTAYLLRLPLPLSCALEPSREAAPLAKAVLVGLCITRKETRV